RDRPRFMIVSQVRPGVPASHGRPGPRLSARAANARAIAHPTAAVARRTPARPVRLTLRKCHGFETDLGVVAVRQPGKPRSHMIDMSYAVRPYTSRGPRRGTHRGRL